MKDMGDRENNQKVISLPFGDITLEVVVPDRIIFNGAMEYTRPADNFEELLLNKFHWDWLRIPADGGWKKWQSG